MTLPHNTTRVAAGAVLAAVIAMPMATAFLPESAFGTAIRMVLAAACIGIVPGLLVTATVGAVAATVIEWFALSFTMSFVVVQALTVVSVVLHVPADVIWPVLWTSSAGIAAWLVVKPSVNGIAITRGSGQWVIASACAAASVTLYAGTSGWIGGEDALHVSVIRRMIEVDRPALDNLYWARDFIYTYPFPATHYFIGLVAKAAALDPLFVYQKLRFFWCPAAVCLVYAVARVTFASTHVAAASGVTAALFMLSGTFGPISGTWGQLAPSSHASDVAMTLLLPALLLTALHAVESTTRRARIFFFTASLTVALTLTVVHVREVVQFLVYIGAAAVAYVATGDRQRAWRFAGLAAATLALAGIYLTWHRLVVGHIDYVVSQRRAILVDAAASMAVLDWVSAPFLNPYFSAAHDFLFYGWFPTVILLAGAAAMAFRGRPLVTAIAASMLAYLLIIRLPLLAVPYIYFTYYEILFTPVRNFLPFIYVLAGPLLLLAAAQVSRLRGLVAQAAAGVATVALLWAASRYLGQWLQLHQDWLFVPAIAMLIAAIARSRAAAAAPSALEHIATTPGRTTQSLFAVIVTALSLVTASWQHSPLRIAGATTLTASEYFSGLKEIVSPAIPEFTDPVTGELHKMTDGERRQVPPTESLARWANASLPTNAVLLSNIFNTYSLPVFMPQQIVMYPIVDGSTIEFNSRLVPQAHQLLIDSARQHRAQPFFNVDAPLDERIAYMKRLGATHVVVDPMYYGRLRELLGRWPDAFELLYDDGRAWAVFRLTK